jgi:hypothetical protein
MKNLIAAVLVFVSFNAFGQNEFNGDWVYEGSPDILKINLNENKLYLYNEPSGLTRYEQIYKIENNQYGEKVVYTKLFLYGHELIYKYYIKNNNLYCYSKELNETLIYKKTNL